MRTDRVGDQQALRELYAASCGRLVGAVGAVVRDRDLAEEAVQDAFVRLMGRWEQVSRYDDPEAWVRKAALEYASNRRRKGRQRPQSRPALRPRSAGLRAVR